MRSDVRDYLRRDPGRQQRAQKFLEDAPEVRDDLGEVILDAHIAAAERLAPSAVASPLFVVRLSGAGVVNGWIDSDMQQEILGPLTQEVELAVPPGARDEVKLGLVGVASGSVLLHYRPLLPSRPADAEQLDYAVQNADAAVLRVARLHRMLEEEEPPATISSAFKDDHSLLRQTRKLVDALEKYSVNLSTRWWGSSAAQAKSVLTRRGRGYARRLFTAHERAERVLLQGKVTGLDISGVVTVTGFGKKKPKYVLDVGPDLVIRPEFELGASVHLWASKKAEVDGAGVSHGRARYIFIRHADNAPLEFP